jgi:hypothetical protein
LDPVENVELDVPFQVRVPAVATSGTRADRRAMANLWEVFANIILRRVLNNLITTNPSNRGNMLETKTV